MSDIDFNLIILLIIIRISLKLQSSCVFPIPNERSPVQIKIDFFIKIVSASDRMLRITLIGKHRMVPIGELLNCAVDCADRSYKFLEASVIALSIFYTLALLVTISSETLSEFSVTF